MNKIVSLLNQLIFEEVQKKTCISLPPDLMEFLDWMLELNSQTTSLQQVILLLIIEQSRGKLDAHVGIFVPATTDVTVYKRRFAGTFSTGQIPLPKFSESTDRD